MKALSWSRESEQRMKNRKNMATDTGYIGLNSGLLSPLPAAHSPTAIIIMAAAHEGEILGVGQCEIFSGQALHCIYSVQSVSDKSIGKQMWLSCVYSVKQNQFNPYSPSSNDYL